MKTLETDIIIIATGGFGDNPKMIKKYTGFEYGKDLYSFLLPIPWTNWRIKQVLTLSA